MNGTTTLAHTRPHNRAYEISGSPDDFFTTTGTDWANVDYDRAGNMTIVRVQGLLARPPR